MTKKPVMLMILDGWGIAPAGKYNAATTASTPNLDRLFAAYPHTQLEASGGYVGLPDGQIGNSEVGHLNIGSGRIIYQQLTRITKACREGALSANKELRSCMEQAAAGNAALHLLGLLSDGGVHSHIEHLLALLQMAKELGLRRVFVHAFLDGRDVPPASALGYLRQLEDFMTELGVGRIATVHGRYYAMDRDKRWERVQRSYKALTAGEGLHAASAVEGVQASYDAGVTDEFVEPFVIDGVDGSIKAGDSVIFFNFRPDRARELTRALNDRDFTAFERTPGAWPLHYVCMTQYDAAIDAPVAFPPETVRDTLGEVLAAHGLRQLRIAETEKYAHVTFFFNGGVEAPVPGEERILIPSPKVATYDLQPEMSAYAVTEALLAELEQDNFDVIILNFANPDMVGHTGVMAAAVKAMEAVDACAGRIVDRVLELGGSVCVTADHGNLEKMWDEETGAPHTAHTTNKVPFILISEKKHRLHPGILADIAPTLLELLGLDKPELMTGNSLIDGSV